VIFHRSHTGEPNLTRSCGCAGVVYLISLMVLGVVVRLVARLGTHSGGRVPLMGGGWLSH
jgi:hypothetical protein